MREFYLRVGKRALDLIGAIVLLVGTLPLLVFGIIAVWRKLGSPIFFIQERIGLKGQPFNLVKLRTMNDDLTLSETDRISPLGNFLRASSIDELPSLLNVLKGEMSLVGPRPLLASYLSRYTPEQMRRHDAKPGITGWAQINGRNDLSWDQKFLLDVWYVDNFSLLTDLKILLLTVKKVIVREGISAAGHATMPEFERPAALSSQKPYQP